MKAKTILLDAILIALSLLPFKNAASQTISDDLRLLDATIEMAPDYAKNKETLISSLESLLSYPNTSLEQQYTIYGQIFHENYSFSFANALSALDQQEVIAKSLGERQRQQVRLDKALLYTTAGMYLEAKDVIDTQLDTARFTPDQQQAYWYLMQRYWRDYNEWSDVNDRKSIVEYYRRKYIDNSTEDDFQHRQLIIFSHMDGGETDEADRLNRELLAGMDSLSHEYAIMSYYQSLICESKGDREGKLHWLIMSAIADVKNAVKDYASLSTVATELLDTDVEKSSHYIQLSIEDALLYNAKLRPLQIARLIPNIDSAYKKKMEATQVRANHWITWLSLVSAMLVAAAFILIGLLRKQTEAKKRLEQGIEDSRKENDSLSERISELTRAFEALSESDEVKKDQVVMLIHNLNLYLDMAKKGLPYAEKEAEIKKYYNIFDSAFLAMYPTFVEDFNALLQPEARIELKKDDMLSTELRIFALIKLGVTQSSVIAGMLRYSVNTIYNYRAQIKNSALDEREDFEKSVRNIGNIEI